MKRRLSASDEDRVTYRLEVTWSKASRERMMRALIECQARLGDSYLYSPELVVMLVRLTPKDAERFREIACHTRWDVFKYASPTDFNNGTLYPRYGSPEEELEARRAMSAMESK